MFVRSNLSKVCRRLRSKSFYLLTNSVCASHSDWCDQFLSKSFYRCTAAYYFTSITMRSVSRQIHIVQRSDGESIKMRIDAIHTKDIPTVENDIEKVEVKIEEVAQEIKQVEQFIMKKEDIEFNNRKLEYLRQKEYQFRQEEYQLRQLQEQLEYKQHDEGKRLQLKIYFLYCTLDKLQHYLWHESFITPSEPLSSSDCAAPLFPREHFGGYVLTRNRVLASVINSIEEQRKREPTLVQSVYMHGCRGSGKTSMLHLLARDFKLRGYEVYYFDTPMLVTADTFLCLKARLKNKNTHMALLIDEVAHNPGGAVIFALLKGRYPNLVIIGAAVPQYLKSGVTLNFVSHIGMTDLMLQEDDEDFLQLIRYFQDKKVASMDVTREVCLFIRNYCGGHVYPTVLFISQFFMNEEAKANLSSVYHACRYFFAEDFSQIREQAVSRCFSEEEELVGSRVMSGIQYSNNDIYSVIDFGWWIRDAEKFISPFLTDMLLRAVSKPFRSVDDIVVLSPDLTSEEYVEKVITEGLAQMRDDDFLSTMYNKSRVSGLSFNWARRARSRIPEANLHYFQECGESGCVDFYLNGIATIEVLLNATQTKSDTSSSLQSQDIDAHLRRFTNGIYPCKNYVLLNFAMSKSLVLPRDTSAHDKVYTFVRHTNTLYRGEDVIAQPAAPLLSED